MAEYVSFGVGENLFDSFHAPGSEPSLELDRVLYVTETEIGILHADGSKSFFTGKGIVFDAEGVTFTAGTITGVKHYTDGKYTDEITGFSSDAIGLFAALANGPAAFREWVFAGDDTLNARARVDNAVVDARLLGFAGDDKLIGGRGDDLLAGGEGDDSHDGGAGNDEMLGGSGADTLRGSDGNDVISGGTDRDYISGGDGNDLVLGNLSFHISSNASDGADRIVGGDGTDTVGYFGSILDLEVTKTSSGFAVSDLFSRDRLTGVERIATDEGTFAFDVATGEVRRVSSKSTAAYVAPEQVNRGTAGDDTIEPFPTSKSIVYGYAGDDKLSGGGLADVMFGGSGDDVILGDEDELSFKTTSSDRLYGDAGNDTLKGLAGHDRLVGGSGNDTLSGGNGNDRLTGNAGADVFVFRVSNGRFDQETWGRDVITDFTLGTDQISLEYRFERTAPEPEHTLQLTSQGWLLSNNFGGSVLLQGLTKPGLELSDLLV